MFPNPKLTSKTFSAYAPKMVGFDFNRYCDFELLEFVLYC